MLVARAVEGPHGGAGEATGRADAATEQHQRRVAILCARLLEQCAPGVFGIAENGLHEGHLRIVAIGSRAVLLGRNRAGLVGQLAEDLQRVLTGKQADHHDHGDTGQAQAAATETAAAAPGVHHVVAAPRLFPTHVRILPKWLTG